MVLFYDILIFSKMGIQGNEGIFFAWDLKGCLKAHQNILLSTPLVLVKLIG